MTDKRSYWTDERKERARQAALSDTHHPWTDERRKRAAQMRRDGFSASQIAVQIGFHTTKNAVCGVLFRMKAPGVLSNRGGRKKGSKNRNPRPVAKIYAERLEPTKGKGEAVPSFRKAPVRVASGVPEPTPKMKTFAELNYRHCRWIYGDPLGLHGYCGHKRAVRNGRLRSYCQFHDDASVLTTARDPQAITDAFVKNTRGVPNMTVLAA
jgi:hypothetical protein